PGRPRGYISFHDRGPIRPGERPRLRPGERERAARRPDRRHRIEHLDETRSGTSVPARLVVDLGSSALSLRLASSFVEKHRDAFAGLQGVVAPIGAGVGGRLMGEVVRLHALHLGDLSIPAPTAGLARERRGALEVGFFEGSIGAPVLAPWFAADYSGRRIFLSREAAREARYDASGLTLTSDGGAVAVDFVAARSPSAEAGLQPGVDIEQGDALVERIKPLARRTARPEVLAGIGGFGGLFEVPDGYREPVLVVGTDGVGTKLKLAFLAGKHDTVGIDLVAMSVNDV